MSSVSDNDPYFNRRLSYEQKFYGSSDSSSSGGAVSGQPATVPVAPLDPSRRKNTVTPVNSSKIKEIKKSFASTSEDTETSKGPSAEKVENKALDIDAGIHIALTWIMEELKTYADKGDVYSKILIDTVFLPTEKEAIEAIEKLPEEKKKILIENGLRLGPDKLHSITLDVLRLAALVKRFDLLRYLFQEVKARGFDTKSVDKRFKWNLAHFIALHSEGKFPIMDIPEVVAMLESPNLAGATPLDFVTWLSEPSPVSVRAFGPKTDFTRSGMLKSLIGHYYWQRSRFTPGALLRLGYESPILDAPVYISNLLAPKICQFIEGIEKAPCKLHIRQMEGNEVPEPLHGQWECLASQDLVAGEIIALYCGRVDDRKWKDPSVKLRNKAFKVCKNFRIDPDQGGGSLPEFINHGFPNCGKLDGLYKGLPIIVILALEKIKKGTVLYMPYGRNFPKKKTCIELNTQGKNRFLESTKNLQKISAYAFSQDGLLYLGANKGKTIEKSLMKPAKAAKVVKAWSNNTKLEFLALNCLKSLETTLDSDVFKWLKGFC